MTRDLIVVGGGPAGAACARQAAENGLDVLVFEKQTPPRRKVCAGGFRPSLRNLLDYDIGPVIERECCGSHVYAPSGLRVVCTRPQITGYTVKRDKFDQFMLQKAEEAGAEINSGVEVLDTEERSDHVTVRCSDGSSHVARLLVAADGVNSRVARVLGIKEKWADTEIGLCVETPVPMTEEEIMRITRGPYEDSERVCIEIFFGGLRHGYAWCFPKRDEVSLGMGCLMPYASGLKRAWEKFVTRFQELNGVHLDMSNVSAMRVPLAGPVKRTATKRVMLAGDAGGFVSAATGEGIYYAIITGKIAGVVAADIINGRATDALEYERRWKKMIGQEMQVSNFLANLMFNSEKNMETVVQMAATDDRMRLMMTDLIGGLRPYSKLRWDIMKRVLLRHPLKGLRMLR